MGHPPVPLTKETGRLYHNLCNHLVAGKTVEVQLTPSDGMQATTSALCALHQAALSSDSVKSNSDEMNGEAQQNEDEAYAASQKKGSKIWTMNESIHQRHWKNVEKILKKASQEGKIMKLAFSPKLYTDGVVFLEMVLRKMVLAVQDSAAPSISAVGEEIAPKQETSVEPLPLEASSPKEEEHSAPSIVVPPSPIGPEKETSVTPTPVQGTTKASDRKLRSDGILTECSDIREIDKLHQTYRTVFNKHFKSECTPKDSPTVKNEKKQLQAMRTKHVTTCITDDFVREDWFRGALSNAKMAKYFGRLEVQHLRYVPVSGCLMNDSDGQYAEMMWFKMIVVLYGFFLGECASKAAVWEDVIFHINTSPEYEGVGGKIWLDAFESQLREKIVNVVGSETAPKAWNELVDKLELDNKQGPLSNLIKDDTGKCLTVCHHAILCESMMGEVHYDCIRPYHLRFGRQKSNSKDKMLAQDIRWIEYFEELRECLLGGTNLEDKVSPLRNQYHTESHYGIHSPYHPSSKDKPQMISSGNVRVSDMCARLEELCIDPTEEKVIDNIRRRDIAQRGLARDADVDGTT